ncbi:hypothetical protein AMBR_FBHANALA_01354 [Dolosigranulum pigrum]|nr:hypothetical protein AMBR_FBHANALA_01354 [Dolosigranulum pigrum]
MLNPVLISVVTVIVLSLLRLNVLLSLIIGGLVGGLLAGMSVEGVMTTLVEGMGGNAATALDYILLGALAAAISQSGVAILLTHHLAKKIGQHTTWLILGIALFSMLSQNVIPVHIAFIPILIPPLLPVFNALKIDRRAIASALTFGLQTPYISIPIGFGLIFHNIIKDELTASGLSVTNNQIAGVMWIPGVAMLIGLLIAIFISYKKSRIYEYSEVSVNREQSEDVTWSRRHLIVLIGAMSALIIQILYSSLALGAIIGLGIMLLGQTFRFDQLDHLLNNGITSMGYIAFVMLVAAGYGNIMRETGGVEQLVQSLSSLVGDNQLLGAFSMLVVGLFITMGIGTSFGTIPIIATIYVPLAQQLGFTPTATILLVGVAAALGDAGSPASDSTLGPTAGLNIDGQHDHIRDTCLPTFLHYNIPLILIGTLAALLIG